MQIWRILAMGNLTHDRLSHRALGHKHLSSGLSHKVSELQPLPNPHTWLRFDEENCTLSGINILSANDKSGNGNHHYALGVGSQQPTIKDNVIGKRQGAKFVRANQQWLFCNALHEPIAAGAGIFVVVNDTYVDNSSGSKYESYFSSMVTPFTGFWSEENATKSNSRLQCGDYSNRVSIHNSQPFTAILYANCGNNTRIYRNNTLLLSSSSSTNSILSSQIGKIIDSISRFYFSEFELCEIFVVDYGRDLTEAEIRQQFRYLNSYYGKVY